MTGADILQVVPPGQLSLHGPLVAISPAILASISGFAAWVSPEWRRGIVVVGCLAAWLLLALALIPGGAAFAYHQPLADGWLALTPTTVSCALATAGAVAFWARRWPPWWWAQGIALGLVLPLVLGAVLVHA